MSAVLAAPRRFGAALAAVSAVVLAAVVNVSPAGAQTGSCPTSTLGAATVSIDSVTPDPPVAGRDVVVRGQATATLPISRAELFVNDVKVASTALAEPGPEVPFTLRWPATTVRPGPARLRAVVCGTGTVGGVLVAGGSTRSVEVGRAEPAAPVAAAPAPGSAGATVVTLPSAAATAGTTPPTSVRPTTTVSTVAPRAEPVETDSPQGQAAVAGAGGPPPLLTLTQEDDEKSPGAPLWVGPVVGLSGLVAVTISALYRRHPRDRARPSPRDGELLDVK